MIQLLLIMHVTADAVGLRCIKIRKWIEIDHWIESSRQI